MESQKNKLNCHCNYCDNDFQIDVELPMDVYKFAMILSSVRCPKCNCGSDHVSVGQ